MIGRNKQSSNSDWYSPFTQGFLNKSEWVKMNDALVQSIYTIAIHITNKHDMESCDLYHSKL